MEEGRGNEKEMWRRSEKEKRKRKKENGKKKKEKGKSIENLMLKLKLT